MKTEIQGERLDRPAHIRWIIHRDMPEVLRIDRDSFEFSWTEEDFLRFLRCRNCIGIVAERGEEVVGFMIYELHEAELSIVRLAVDPWHRHEHIGSQMVVKLLDKLSSHRRLTATVEVRETNLSAQLFFRYIGFLATRVLHHFYEDSGEDAYLMQYSLVKDTP